MESPPPVRRKARPGGVAVQRTNRDDGSPNGLAVGTHDAAFETAARWGFCLILGFRVRLWRGDRW